ncbi:MAG: dTDP-4-dehydrorhamnose 3,5-epimerase [Gammaproteobacteria bacterium]|nr:dTDP-4-dehydrorhamnose 3,5-epimerase [Gammaproteobacteria bacterium]
MKITETAIADVWVLDPTVHGDDRGYFMESFRASYFIERGVDMPFVQDNQSKSVQGTLRGLHYQLTYPQGKLIRVISGEVFDVAVDLRQGSSSYGHWVGERLSADNRRQLWVPPGFAHGFYVISNMAELAYKCTAYYHPEDDRCITWNDPDIGVQWPLLFPNPLLSSRDLNGVALRKASTFP